MSDQEPHELDQEVREIFARGDVGRHPSSEELVAYARGELPEAEAVRVQEHLGPCSECTAAVLALEFPRLGADAADPLPDAEVAAGVEAIVSQTSPASPSRVAGRSRALYAIAAVLAVACLSLALFAVKLGREVGELKAAMRKGRPAPEVAAVAPQTGVPIIDLYPSSVVRGETPPASIRLDGDATMVALILTPTTGPSHPAYALRIFDAADALLWQGPAHPNEAGAFVVVLPRRFVEAAPERLELYGVDGSREQRLETYRVHIQP